MRIIVLASGGLDSSLLCLLLMNRGFEVQPLFIDYGQLASQKEWESCQNMADYLAIHRPDCVDLSGFGRKIRSGLTTKELDIANPYLPNRNLMFLVIGSSYAVTENVSCIAIGLLSTHVFPDQTRDFVDSAQQALRVSLGTNIDILTPLIGLNKQDVVQLAEHHNFPLRLIYSCHMGNEVPCGRCMSCLEIGSVPHMAERRRDDGTR